MSAVQHCLGKHSVTRHTLATLWLPSSVPQQAQQDRAEAVVKVSSRPNASPACSIVITGNRICACYCIRQAYIATVRAEHAPEPCALLLLELTDIPWQPIRALCFRRLLIRSLKWESAHMPTISQASQPY